MLIEVEGARLPGTPAESDATGAEINKQSPLERNVLLTLGYPQL
jgi:hypothetical protein